MKQAVHRSQQFIAKETLQQEKWQKVQEQMKHYHNGRETKKVYQALYDDDCGSTKNNINVYDIFSQHQR